MNHRVVLSLESLKPLKASHNIMVIDDILEVIVARKHSDGTKVISICGAADLGKSFFG